mgnify:FL=1
MYLRYVDNFNRGSFKTTGYYGIPAMKYQRFKISDNITPFNERNNNADGIHFFIDDYQFQRIWNRPDAYIEMLKKYKFVCSPDFSLYMDMPRVMQIWNHYKKQWLACYFQSFGINVVATVSWSDEKSFEFCFDGIPKGSCVAVSSVGVWDDKKSTELFKKGYTEMIRRISPDKIIYFGRLPKELKANNVIEIDSRCRRMNMKGMCSDVLKYSNVWR